MNQLEFNFEKSLIPSEQIKPLEARLISEIKKINQATKNGYEDVRASINLSVDAETVQQVLTVVNRKKMLNPNYIVVIGIGGSNLGTVAVFEAVLGKKHNQKHQWKNMLFADTVDADLLNDIKEIVEPVLKNNGNILLNVVSKSGSTTETIANFEVLMSLLERYVENPEDFVVVTTDHDSKLWHLAKKEGYDVLEIPKNVGGRFSVFSAVGLFPLAMIGINIIALLEGAKMMRSHCLTEGIEHNPAAQAAAISFLQYSDNKNIHDLFLFSDDLESVGKWYRQLFAESLGKEFDINGEQVFTGFTPTFSIGSTDLHSMAQLYLGGPYDKLTTFVQVKNNKQKINLPNLKECDELVHGIQGKNLQEIMNAIYEGVKTAFVKGNRPFMEVMLPDKSEESIGQFLQFQMMQVMLLGSLLQVNPFDQPNVEAYKKETRRLLKN